MNTKIAGIDLLGLGLGNEYRITILEKTLNKIVTSNPNIRISKNEIKDIRRDVVKALQQKYPQAGIEPTE